MSETETQSQAVLARSRLQQRLVDMRRNEPFFPKEYWTVYGEQDITDLFVEDMMLRLLTWQTNMLFVLGSPGTGKSLLGMVCGKILSSGVAEVFNIDRPFTVSGSIRSDMLKVIQLLSNATNFSTIMHDESLKLQGMGSGTSLNQLKNIMKASARHDQINVILVGNEFLSMRLYNYVLITRDRYIDPADMRKTVAVTAQVWMQVWEDLQGNYFPIGTITLPVALIGEEFIHEYEEQEKVGKVKSVKEEEGFAEGAAQAANFIQQRRKAVRKGREIADDAERNPSPLTTPPQAQPQAPDVIPDDAPCPTCKRKTMKGYVDRKQKVVRWACFACSPPTVKPDTPIA